MHLLNIFGTLPAIWYHFYNLKNEKNTYGGALILVKFEASVKVILLHGYLSRFLYCTNGTKLHKAPHYLGTTAVQD